jgi:hypothetical protein
MNPAPLDSAALQKEADFLSSLATRYWRSMIKRLRIDVACVWVLRSWPCELHIAGKACAEETLMERSGLI